MIGASIRFKVLSLVAIPLVFELIVAGGLYFLVQASEKETERARRASQISHLISSFVSDYIAERNSLAFEFETPMTHSDRDFTKDALETFRQLEVLFDGDKERLSALETTRTQVQAAQLLVAEARKANEKGDVKGLQQFKEEAGRLGHLIADTELIAIGQIERKIGKTAPTISEKYEHLIVVFLMVNVVATITLALVVLWTFNRNFCRRLQVVKENAERFASEEALYPPLSGSDEIAQLENCFRATTEVINEARRREKGIVQQARDFMFSLDGDHVISSANPAAASLLGYAPEAVVGRAFEELVDGTMLSKTNSDIENVKSHSKWTFETRLERANGQAVDVMFSGQYAESTQRIFGIVRDISPSKELERVQQEIVAMVSHDLRTPLTTVRHIHEMCLDGLIPSDRADLLSRVVSCEHAAQRMLWLIGNLLATEKNRAGMLISVPDKVQLSALFDDCNETLVPFAAMRSITIVSTCQPVAVVCDEEQLKQTLLNLVLLLIDYGTAGGQIKMSSVVGSEMVSIIIDSNSQFPLEFVSFMGPKADSPKQPFGGAGLSLAAARIFMVVNGGVLRLENDPKENRSSILIELPLG